MARASIEYDPNGHMRATYPDGFLEFLEGEVDSLDQTASGNHYVTGSLESIILAWEAFR